MGSLLAGQAFNDTLSLSISSLFVKADIYYFEIFLEFGDFPRFSSTGEEHGLFSSRK